MPYVGAFTTHTELLLVPHVTKIKNKTKQLLKHLRGMMLLLKQEEIFPLLFIPCRKLHFAIFFMKQMTISLLQ